MAAVPAMERGQTDSEDGAAVLKWLRHSKAPGSRASPEQGARPPPCVTLWQPLGSDTHTDNPSGQEGPEGREAEL